MNYFKKYFLVTFFFLFLGLLGASSFMNVQFMNTTKPIFETKNLSLFEKDKILKQKQSYKETALSENFSNKLFFVEKYGGLQKLLGKKLVDDPIDFRRVYKGENDMLYYILPTTNINNTAVERILNLKNELSHSNIPVAFVMPPNKHDIASKDFPYGVLDYTTTNSNDLYNKLVESGIPTLNMNELYFKEKLESTKHFYMTDTHWKNETAFWGYLKTLDFFKNELSYKYYNNTNSYDLNNYKIQTFTNTYIGSMGKRTGKDYISKKDDYTLITPKFKTNYTYKKYDENYNVISEKYGNFEKVFVNKNILNSKDDYIDKYTTMMGYGSPCERITNENIKDKSKLVIIKDSYAMPLSAYLSNNIQDIYLLDTRYENIRKTLVQKIQTINPDYVVFVCSPSSVFYFKDMFAF